MLEKGIKGSQEKTVTVTDTALHYKSGLVEVFATPAMVAFMEYTAADSVQSFLPEGSISVGIEINTTHAKATPVGGKVRCDSLLTDVDGRKLTFSIVAHDEHGEIGRATHARFVVDKEKFMSKL